MRELQQRYQFARNWTGLATNSHKLDHSDTFSPVSTDKLTEMSLIWSNLMYL